MVEKALFSPEADHDLARELFKRYVGSVELETFSYCNRRCNYCPNAVIDRISENIFLDAEIFERIISNLSEISYSGQLTLSNYNEPLANRKILEHIAIARSSLPDALIQIFTNGDYLNIDYFKELIDAGLSALYISIHLSDTAEYNDIKIFDRINEMSVRIGIPAKHKHYDPGKGILAEFPHKNIKVQIFEQDYANVGGNRGGLLKHIPVKQRSSPCFYPFNTMTIAHNGYIMPCCQVRADAIEHEVYRIGHILDFPSIFEAYAASKLVDWRRSLFTFGPKSSPCDSCNQACVAGDPDEIARRDELAISVGIRTREQTQGAQLTGIDLEHMR